MRILFVCGRNAFQSPMAEAVARRMFSRSGHEFRSAGTEALAGAPGDPLMISALLQQGIRFQGHRTRPLMADLILDADQIWTTNAERRAQLLEMSAQARHKTAVLSPGVDWEYRVPPRVEDYRAFADRLEEAICRRMREFGYIGEHP